MSEVYATVQFGREQDNTQHLGAIVAFLASRDLLDARLIAAHASAVARVKMQDLNGAEFLTTVLNGELRATHCSPRGQSLCRVLLQGDEAVALRSAVDQSKEEDWLLFDEVLPQMSAALRAVEAPPSGLKRLAAKVLQFPGPKR
ncbi:MAG: hypothetical protein CMP96_03565 [Gammaproteobacteria bacterium]|jgi:hypothetical protein|nr:hypothetical protein [Gammaproteobacteria bacterium]